MFSLKATGGGREIPVPNDESVIGRGTQFEIEQIDDCDWPEHYTVETSREIVSNHRTIHVTDKRVSRSHAKIAVENGLLRLLPTHANPCFYAPNSSTKREALKRNEWKTLEDGSVLSLLPNDCVFHIVKKKVATAASGDNGGGSDTDIDDEMERAARDAMTEMKAEMKAAAAAAESKPSTSDASTGNEGDGTSARNTEAIPPRRRPCVGNTQPRPDSPTSPDMPSANCCSTMQLMPAQPGAMPSQSQGPRQLPAWMTQGPTQTGAASAAPARKRAQSKAAAPKPAVAPKTGPAAYSDSDEEVLPAAAAMAAGTSVGAVSQRAPARQKAARRNLADYSDSGGDDQAPDAGSAACTSPRKQTARPAKKNLADFSESGDDSSKRPARAGAQKRSLKDFSDSDIDEEENQPLKKKRPDPASASSNTSALLSALPPCQYGATCYRKNPQHLLEYSHPDKNAAAAAGGDSYDAGSGDDSGDACAASGTASGAASGTGASLPECPYGQLCYRKNPKHKQMFAHNLPGVQSDSDDNGVRRSKRKKTRRKMTSLLAGDSDDDGEANAYDYNDSFLDDSGESASSVSPDDSEDTDFDPGSGGDSDLGELVSEAKGFLSNKKMQKPV